ncbi:MAG: FAD:protein FMN transferase [Clostridiales bacterium]|nr:FAD:protein FMN transferase [Clostridiales bacterium]
MIFSRTGNLPVRLFRIIAAVLLTAVIIIPQTGCGGKEPVSGSEFCLDTSCEITIYDMEGMSEDKAAGIIDQAFAEIREYENMLSRTVEGSDVYRINHADGKSTEVSAETLDVIHTGLLMAELSGGKFDITVGALTDLWKFTSDNPSVPEDQEIRKALETVGYENITMKGNEVGLSDSETRIDLGGVAKGYIADKTGEYMEAQGVTKAIINLGGNITAIGEKEEDTPWTIGIERPYSDRSEIVGSIKVSDKTVVTSGIYERQFVEDGVRYHHVLDPQTGYPAETDLEAVTITAVKGNSGFCDSLSTACLILGKEKAHRLVLKLQDEYPQMEIEAAFIDKNDNIAQTDGMNLELVEK